MAHALTSLVEQHGIVAILVLMALESCGIPVPSEAVMPFAGYLAAAGHLGFAAAVAAGAIGNLAGSLVAFALAARFGRPLLLGPGRRVGISAAHLELADRWFARHGLIAVFAGRMLPVVRTYISFPAGLARVDLGRFSVLTLLGSAPWCAALTGAGYAVGKSYERISGPVETIAILIAVALAGVVVAWIVRGRSLRRREMGTPD